MCSTFSATLADTRSDFIKPGISEPFSSWRSNRGGNGFLLTTFRELLSAATSAPLRASAQTSPSADLPVSGPASQQQSMASERAKACGPKCYALGSTPASNSLSWSSPRAMRNGKPKSRTVWRDLASTAPELSSRLAILVRLISAGECSFLPTPVSRDCRSPGKPSHPRLSGSRGQPLPETLGVRLHPEICEWLMGLPVGWTEMLPSRQLEIPTLPQWPQSSAAQFSLHTNPSEPYHD